MDLITDLQEQRESIRKWIPEDVRELAFRLKDRRDGKR
jgi:hypothetical protein